MDPGEVYPLFNFNFNFNSRPFVCSNPATSQPRVIYLFMPRFIMPSSRARALVAFPPSLPSIPAVGSIANSLLIFFFFVKKKFKRKKFRFDTWTCWFEKDLIESFVHLVAFCFTHSGVECEFWTFEFVYNLIRQILRIKLKLKFWEFIRELTIFLSLPVRLQ